MKLSVRFSSSLSEIVMNRRDFLKTTVIAGVGLSIDGNFDYFIRNLNAADHVDIAVAQGRPPGTITKAAIDIIGGMGKFITNGDIVVVKPNIGWDRKPEQAANTNPEVIATIVNLCYDAGASTVKVFDRPVSDPRRCYKQSGIADAASAAGAEVSFIDTRKFKKVAIDGILLKDWPLYTDILEADKIINVPVAKTHGLATLTLGMKNWMGVMGGWRSRIHQSLDESLVDVSRVIKPTLIVLDAVRILTANGPQGGSLDDVRELNTVIAGTDQVAVDAYGATLFGLTGGDLGYVRIGHQSGLGTMDLSKLVIRKVAL
jgi:uncharacterized protein (DUF362 family)